MTWTKLSDDFSDDCWTLSDAAVRLHVDGLVWSNRKLLDSRIPASDLVRMSRAADAVDELVNAGWWTQDGDEFVIRHHAMYQPTRDHVVSIQERNRVNGAKGGRRPKAGRERVPLQQDQETQSVTQLGSQLATQHETQRDGTGRDGVVDVPATQLSSFSATEEKQDGRHLREVFGGCVECQRRSVYDSGPCPHHREAS